MVTRQNKIENRLAGIRVRRGISPSALAEAVGVSRQAIYAIEAGAYVPNTVLTLRLARALAVSVEELFTLPEDSPPREPRSVRATLIPSADNIRPGQPLQIAEVNNRLVAVPCTPLGSYLPPSDAIMADCDPVADKIRVRLHQDSNQFANRLLVAGCDPAMPVLARHARNAGLELVLVHRNSSDSLLLLKKGRVHIAGTHLRDVSTGESNIHIVKRLFATGSVAVISFATWQEGLITAPGNPKRIRKVEDLARKNVLFVNREPGSGSRLLLDGHLTRVNLDAKRIRGYDRFAPGHIEAASQVAAGAVDCCLATEGAARFFGLDFLPLESSRYDLVMREEHLQLPAVQSLLNTIALAAFHREMNGAGGYDTTIAGQRVI